MSRSSVSVKVKYCFEKLGSNITNTKKLVRNLNKTFKTDEIEFIGITEKSGSNSDDIMVYGYFCPDKPKNKIVIVLVFNKEKSPEYSNSLAFNIEVVIEHEKVHLQQEIKRNGFILKPKSYNLPSPLSEEFTNHILYFSEPDEIDAYAKQILLEVRYYLGDLTLSQLKDRLIVSDTWGLYQSIGVKENVKRRLLRKICKWHRINTP